METEELRRGINSLINSYREKIRQEKEEAEQKKVRFISEMLYKWKLKNK